jgi:hypothetical protein
MMTTNDMNGITQRRKDAKTQGSSYQNGNVSDDTVHPTSHISHPASGIPYRAYSRAWVALDVLLFLIIIGPVIAPLFVASNVWLLERIALWIIYPLGQLICPQDQHALHIGKNFMAVCTRCYAAIGGLFLVRLALTSDPNGQGVGSRLARWWLNVPSLGRLFFIVGIIALWQFDLWAERVGWWSWEQPMLIATGPIVGLAIGFLVYGLLAWLTHRRPAWA